MKLRPMKGIKKELEEPSDSNCNYTVVYRCKYCDHLTFNTETHLRAHTEQSHAPEVLAYSCMFCSAFISSLQCFTIHLRTSHPKEQMIPRDQLASRLEAVSRNRVVTLFYTYALLSDANWSRSQVPAELDMEHALNIGTSVSAPSEPLMKVEKRDLIDSGMKETRTTTESSPSDITDKNVSGNEGNSDLNVLLPQSTNRLMVRQCNGARATDSCSTQLPQTSTYCLGITSGIMEIPWRAMGAVAKKRGQTCVRCGQRFKNWCMFTKHMIEHKRARNPYKCLFPGCLESYCDRKKLLGHLYNKHPDISQTDKETMLLKGDAADALTQQNRELPIQSIATELPTANALASSNDGSAVSSQAIPSERSQNLRELRANRRSRINLLSAEATSKQVEVSTTASNAVDTTFGYQPLSVSVTARPIAPLNIVPQSTTSHRGNIGRKMARQERVHEESAMEKSQNALEIKQQQENISDRTRRPHWKTKLTVRQLLGKETPRRGGARCVVRTQWPDAHQMYQLVAPVLMNNNSESSSLLDIEREIVAERT